MSGTVSRDIVCSWQEAVEAVDQGRLGEAKRLFWDIRHFSAKIWFNLSTVDLLSGDYTGADEKLAECLQRDAYLAVAYYQRGVIACLLGRLPQGKEMFTEAQKNIRSGESIDYRQLGLALRLSRQQVEHNQAALQVKLRAGNNTCKMSAGELEILPHCLFRPAKGLVDNVHKRQFLQKAKVVSSVPDIVQDKKTTLVGSRSFSAPTSPASHRRLSVGAPTLKEAHTPPPSRPPPRLPHTTVVGHNHHGNIDGCDQQGNIQPSIRGEGLRSSCCQASGAVQKEVCHNQSPIIIPQTAARHLKGKNSLSDLQHTLVKTVPVHVSDVLQCEEKRESFGGVAAMIKKLNMDQDAVKGSSKKCSIDLEQPLQALLPASLGVPIKGKASNRTCNQDTPNKQVDTKTPKPKPARPPPPKFVS